METLQLPFYAKCAWVKLKGTKKPQAIHHRLKFLSYNALNFLSFFAFKPCKKKKKKQGATFLTVL